MSNRVRTSVIAGTWYPRDRDELQSTIEGYFRNTGKKTIQGEIMGLISPHAGYIYSGQVAAFGYRQVLGKRFEAVVVLSPSHQMMMGKYVVNNASYYETPLGRIPVAEKWIEEIAARIELVQIPREMEHSLEIQLPFLQMALGDFNLVPIMIGHSDVYEVEDLVSALVYLFKGKRVLMVASTDLHHINHYDEVIKKDRAVIEALSRFNLEEIRAVLSRNDCSVCGRVPVSVVMEVCQKLGADQLIVLCQTNSGEVTGEKRDGQYTVGYLSAAIVRR